MRIKSYISVGISFILTLHTEEAFLSIFFSSLRSFSQSFLNKRPGSSHFHLLLDSIEFIAQVQFLSLPAKRKGYSGLYTEFELRYLDFSSYTSIFHITFNSGLLLYIPLLCSCLLVEICVP
ncbi:hypothetical protein RIF29_25289 [Crotalaria pallida]|uniref:Uncharacterized protein n=1 Tax=Crotalaria pallida TaxID=3830 RepID=A0AAN9I427_CROPI